MIVVAIFLIFFGLVFGLLLLPRLDFLWTFALLALGYLLLAPSFRSWSWGVAVLSLGLLLLSPRDLGLVEKPAGSELVRTRIGSMGTVSVIRDSADQRTLRLNNRFQMGGTAAVFAQRRQAHLPLLLHPHPGKARERRGSVPDEQEWFDPRYTSPFRTRAEVILDQRPPKMNRRGSSPSSSNPERDLPTPMRRARPLRPLHPAIGSSISSPHLERVPRHERSIGLTRCWTRAPHRLEAASSTDTPPRRFGDYQTGTSTNPIA